MYTNMNTNVHEASVPDGKKRQLGEDFAMARISSCNWSCSIPTDHKAMTSRHDVYIDQVFGMPMLCCISAGLKHSYKFPTWVQIWVSTDARCWRLVKGPGSSTSSSTEQQVSCGSDYMLD